MLDRFSPYVYKHIPTDYILNLGDEERDKLYKYLKGLKYSIPP